MRRDESRRDIGSKEEHEGRGEGGEGREKRGCVTLPL